MTRRRWIADTWDKSSASLRGDQAAHLARVLRAQAGMIFDVVVDGHVFEGTVTEISEVMVKFSLGQELDADPALPLTLLLAVFKFDRMEWAIEKATELGVERIVPVIARRTEKHLAKAAEARVERWRRIAREAAQQSRRSDTVVIHDAIALKDAVREEPSALRLLLSETARAATLRDAIAADDARSETNNQTVRRVRSAIGPEGGWAADEETLFATEGWMPVTLGPRILRAETAAIAAVSIIAALLT